MVEDSLISELYQKERNTLKKMGALYDNTLLKHQLEYLDNKKENKEMKRTKSQIEKEIIENVNSSDVLQKTNKILESMKVEELKKENPNNFTFDHKNDYLAHLKAIYQLNVLQESNREEIGKLGMEYINLKKETVRIGGKINEG